MLKVAGPVVDKCDVCAGSEQNPHLPAAGTSRASTVNEKVQADPLFLGNLITIHAMDLLPQYSKLVLVSSKNPSEAWDALAASRITAFGTPRCSQTNSGG